MDEDELPQTLVTGSANSTEVTGSGFDRAAVLWVPDPEARRGWREYYIDKPQSQKPGLGFKPKHT